MDPPSAPASSQPQPPRPTAMPRFRSFVSVELPFTLAPTVTCATQPDLPASAAPCVCPVGAANDVEAFLPASFVAECLQRAVPQRTSVRPDDTVKRRGDGGGGAAPAPSANTDDADLHADSADDESRSSSSGSSSGGSDGDDDVATAGVAANREGATKKISTQKSEVRLLTRHRRDYCTDPIFSNWRSTNWEAVVAKPSDTDEERRDRMENYTGDRQEDVDDAADGTQSQKRRRQEVFPSIEPQVLLNGYYRNDLLVQVRRTRRVRRFRDPATNAVLREELIPNGADNGSGGREGGRVGEPTLATAVLGVVSRELELARPADFTFSLFTPEQLRESPSLCGADFFPPAHYLSAKAPFEVRYEPGKDANTSVTSGNHVDGAASLAALRGDPAGASAESGTNAELRVSGGTPSAALPPTGVSSQFEFGALPTISVGPEETTALPTRLHAHDDFLHHLPSSLDGSRDDDPPEVRMMVRLLAERPAWIVHDLTNAMLQSGVCPRTHRNKQVMNCFTYVIRNGPFNRLRLRLGYDPYANSSSAPYERIAVRLHRRSDIGVRLRDVSRSPLIENVLRLLLERDRARRVAYKAEPGHERRSTLLELQCRAIREGLLVLPYQPIDAMDDAVIADVVRNVVVVDEPMERSQRGQRRGWLSEAAYTRAMTHFTDSLVLLLEQEVEPLLRKFNGEDEAAHAKMKKSGPNVNSTTSASQQTTSRDDEEDNSSFSAMSSATAGDLSSDDDDE
ncbi:hypothetical protein ABB37_06424 [Leptomonas pyrrhocoris]|uniref:Transcription factor IIIC subunit 5 HTH domain-containing protein n=1 Tax=Leptomonas pyrrhocoris TaxID=157538 RepID=A0A0M9FXR5_LEPPY|nr:hypothetical protein ABB37_06424 [Leptomonas pyrrhocoris]XP_015656720.1 hypothetical protein ABB37_06424 [Leptomonas pyrrhocoris]KPA78280.1 hypothetical protein ABB37_06424 [Leptomonas pyrrhocoris]KPA78281.1 hypothetical protein ABB37_06424 [Leptomonas pyrrhocoris]|eukprot:XP_015656719.1 hypothetical protein ABB37_06424 [Leptomonas pyrrhocoris]